MTKSFTYICSTHCKNTNSQISAIVKFSQKLPYVVIKLKIKILEHIKSTISKKIHLPFYFIHHKVTLFSATRISKGKSLGLVFLLNTFLRVFVYSELSQNNITIYDPQAI